jgi:hypothetical protein
MMKKLRFEKLELLSLKEQKARQIEFHPEMTVLTGANDVGKSSVIKSLYWAFGASSSKIHPSWVKANVVALVTFTVGSARYKILRLFDSFGVFNEDGDLLISTSQITKELGPFLGELLDFKLVLTSRQGEPQVPPPAYAFLPFYIDQDGGWGKPLDSFANLGQYPDFRKALIEFHTGILPNEYYELEAQKRGKQLEQKVLEADRKVVRKAIKRFNLEPSFDGTELTIEGHEKAIEELLQRLKELRLTRRERARVFADILDERTAIEQQIKIVRAAISEIDKDIKFAGEQPDEIYCPTCGTTHTNDFKNRYGVIDDREACLQFLAEGHQKLVALAQRANQAEIEVRGTDQALSKLQTILDEKRGSVSLKQVIESRGRNIALEMFDKQIDDIDSDIAKIIGAISDIADEMLELKDKGRRDRIVADYTAFMLDYLEKLDVVNFDIEQVSKIPAVISDTGSDLPRSILSYFLAIVNTIYKHSTSIHAPIIVDSPNQQDQDKINVGAMIDLIVSARPAGAQVILGTVSLHDREIVSGKVIEFTEKKSVLRESEYDDVFDSITPYRNMLVLGQTS